MVYTFIDMSEQEFETLSRLITARYGIKLPAEKRVMVQARLQSRLRQLQFLSFKDYCDYLLTPVNTEVELEQMISLVSTNKTEFFREDQHFKYLQKNVLPELTAQMKDNGETVLKCWSAGCSGGQEAFSIAMVIDNYFRQLEPKFDFSILGTDVSGKVLIQAIAGIYPLKEASQIPKKFLKQYVLKSKDQSNPRIKISKGLRNKVRFQSGNLMDKEYDLEKTFQIVFLRNTLIYFGHEDQTAILEKVLRYLEPGGYLFIGHSESLINLQLPIRIIAPSIYQKL